MIRAPLGSLLPVLVLFFGSCTPETPINLTSADIEQIRAVDRAYADGWLANDSAGVMATLTDDAVLVPSGMPVLEGKSAILEFWWPEDSPPTAVTEFTLVQHEVEGLGGMAFLRGSFTLHFDYDGNSYANRGEYLSILRRDDSGNWRISRRMWSDRPRR